MGERTRSHSGSSISSCRCDDGGSNDRVRSLINVYNRTTLQYTVQFKLVQVSVLHLARPVQIGNRYISGPVLVHIQHFRYEC